MKLSYLNGGNVYCRKGYWKGDRCDKMMLELQISRKTVNTVLNHYILKVL